MPEPGDCGVPESACCCGVFWPPGSVGWGCCCDVPDSLGWLRHIPLISDRLVNRSRHGFNGWLGTNVASQALALGDGQLLKIMRATALLGAHCYLVGMSPAAAQTTTSLGIDLGSLQSYRDMQSALADLLHGRDVTGAGT